MTPGPGPGTSPYWAVVVGLLLLWLALGCEVAHAQWVAPLTGWGRPDQLISSGNGSGTGDVESVTLTAPAAGFTISGSPCLSGACSHTFTLANDLAGLEGLTTTGLATRTGDGTWATVTDGSAVGQVLRRTGALTYGWGALDLADGDAVTGELPRANVALPGVLDGSGSTTTVSTAVTHDGTVYSNGSASDKVTLGAESVGTIKRFSQTAGSGPFKIAPGAGQTIVIDAAVGTAVQASGECWQFSGAGTLSLQRLTPTTWITVGLVGTVTKGTSCS